MKNLFKNKKRLVLILLAGISVLSVFFILSATNKKAPPYPVTTPSSPSIASWNKLTPGVSTRQDVVDILGQPKTVEGDVFTFKSSSPTRDNEAVVKNDTTELLKEIVAFSENRTTEEIASKYGTSQYMLYGQDSVNGDYLFVYPSNGIAYLGNPITKGLLEIWYFRPTTIGDFMSTWAKDYSLTPPKGQF